MEKFDLCEGTVVHEAAVKAVQERLLSEALFSDAANFFKVMGDGTAFASSSRWTSTSCACATWPTCWG